ncbi:hypothetical protein BJY04DRAFT_197037 [Aspergillus karnatakaensis]|uniref:uncharacterized protein n=1 Tax=Aspergillus karnatakaensis TaxID=1810916 RepID=UPI003CCCD0BC
MVKSTRASYSCARCYRRKKKCDRSYPSCSQCTIAKAKCIALDRGSNSELPRSLASHLEDLVAQLKHQRNTRGQTDKTPNLITPPSISPVSLNEVGQRKVTAHGFAAAAAKNSAPLASSYRASCYALPYYRGFFKSAELPFPLAFQGQRPCYVPSSHGGESFTQLPEEVANKLMKAYIERILPQYPLFLKQEVIEMFQRFKSTGTSLESGTADEQFTIYMIMAIATLSSKTRNYRKLLSVAESLRRDAFSCFDFGLSASNATTATIQHLLLLAQYGFLLPSSTNLWQVVGDASRIALELGLHLDVPAECGLNKQAMADRKRIYWTVSFR